MFVRGDFFGNMPWANWYVLIYDHTLPFALLLIEWRFSAIPVDWNRYPIYIGIGFVYLSTTVGASLLLGEAIYASMNWLCHPLISIPIVMGVQLF